MFAGVLVALLLATAGGYVAWGLMAEPSGQDVDSGASPETTTRTKSRSADLTAAFTACLDEIKHA